MLLKDAKNSRRGEVSIGPDQIANTRRGCVNLTFQSPARINGAFAASRSSSTASISHQLSRTASAAVGAWMHASTPLNASECTLTAKRRGLKPITTRSSGRKQTPPTGGSRRNQASTPSWPVGDLPLQSRMKEAESTLAAFWDRAS